MGTVFFFSGAVSAAQLKRSSSQSRTPVSRLTSSLPLAADYDFIAPHVHLKNIQRTRRGPRDVSSVQVVKTVVAGAPDLVEVVAVLHRATQMRAGCGKGAILAFGGQQQQS